MKSKKKVIILGAGVTGLRVGSALAKENFDVTLIEKTGKVGGMCASFSYKDFILDYGPHKFYTQIPGVYDDFKKIVGNGNFLTVEKKNSIRLLGNYFAFPVKISELFLKIPITTSLEIFLGLIKAKLDHKKIGNYEDYFVNGFGRKGYDIIFKGFAQKVWGDPKSLAEELARKRSPASSIFDVLKTALIKNDKNVSAETFLYPRKGYGVIGEKLSVEIKRAGGKIILEQTIKGIQVMKNGKKVITIQGKSGKSKKISADIVVSSLAINDLVKLIANKKSSAILQAAEQLKFRSLVISYVFLNKKRALKDNWVFFPEREFCFNRVAEQKSFSPETCPENKTVLTAEITCDYGDETYSAPEEVIKEKVIKDLEKAGLIQRKEVIDFITRKAGRVYPVYSIHYKDSLNKVLAYLDSIPNLYSVGRLGLFNYNNADHCLDMALVTSKIIIDGAPLSEWVKARDYFDSYRIVD